MTARLLLCFFKRRESGSSSNMMWDGVQYLYPNKRKTTGFSKFSVIFWEEKLRLTYFHSHVAHNHCCFFFFKKIDEITWSFVVYNFIHDDC